MKASNSLTTGLPNKETIESIIPAMNLPGMAEKSMFMTALKRFEVTDHELIEAFWLAYADPYVPSAGIEFRHLWKHIEGMRGDQKTYTWREMRKVIDKEYPGMADNEVFECLNGKEGRPDKRDGDNKPLWRRK